MKGYSATCIAALWQPAPAQRARASTASAAEDTGITPGKVLALVLSALLLLVLALVMLRRLLLTRLVSLCEPSPPSLV